MYQRFIILFVGMILVGSISAKPLNHVQWRAPTGTVSLTFDDGPNPTYTPQILKILQRNHIKATFFVMGWAAKKYPKLIKQIAAEGSAVASHTMTHLMLTKLSPQKLAYEIQTPKKVIAAILGKPPVCVRPPYGAGNKRVGAYIRSQGMIMVPMGFNSFDYKRPGTHKIASWVIQHAHSRMVVLLHDGPKAREQTVKALPLIIKGIRAKGLGFSAICYP